MDNKPWLTEPNALEWTDETTSLGCLILRHPELLHLCGYVKIPVNYIDDAALVRGPGGAPCEITFTGRFHGKRGEEYNGFYIGFDCAHYMDLVPGMPTHLRNTTCTYKDIEYVKQIATELAAWIHKSKLYYVSGQTSIQEFIDEFGPESELSADQLDVCYSLDGQDQHPTHTQNLWVDAVVGKDTLVGYWKWVKYRLNGTKEKSMSNEQSDLSSSLMQDSSRGLSKWLADKPDARQHARDAAQDLPITMYETQPATIERNFCERCGKRLAGADYIHTCTLPLDTFDPDYKRLYLEVTAQAAQAEDRAEAAEAALQALAQQVTQHAVTDGDVIAACKACNLWATGAAMKDMRCALEAYENNNHKLTT